MNPWVNACLWLYRRLARAFPHHVVSPEYFSTLGVRPAAGRFFQTDLDKLGAAPVVVVSDRFWRTRLNADPPAVGRTLRIALAYAISLWSTRLAGSLMLLLITGYVVAGMQKSTEQVLRSVVRQRVGADEAMGRRIREGKLNYRVVGVARDVKSGFLIAKPAPTIFLPPASTLREQ